MSVVLIVAALAAFTIAATLGSVLAAAVLIFDRMLPRTPRHPGRAA